MGVTWVFGFVSQSVTGILAFSYIYIILNYLQAVFIFLGFCLNKRVRGLWTQKMRAKQTATSTNSPSQSKSNAKTASTGVPATLSQVMNTTTESTKL